MDLEELYKKHMTEQQTKLLETLTKNQQEAYTYMTKGKNVFITGPGGCGKTFLMKIFKKIYGTQKTIALTSLTGISAILLNGTTLHSYLGIGLGTASVESLKNKIIKKSFLKKRWQKLETIIIDEISMLDPELFDKLEEVSRFVRKCEKPFGGIQLIISGDFCFSGNTEILLSNGKIILAKNIKVGDFLIGDDGNKRKVVQLYRGRAKMYKITMSGGGKEFTVTGNHILCFRFTKYKNIYWNKIHNHWIVYDWDKKNNYSTQYSFSSKKYSSKENAFTKAQEYINTLSDNLIVEMSVKKYLSLTPDSQCLLVCYKVGVSKWTDYKFDKISIHPWLLGAWLGNDGQGDDQECVDQFSTYLGEMNARGSPLETELSVYNLINNKHIPDEYLYSSRENRLELLAGLLDTDGSLVRNTFQISQKNEILYTQICFLARSLGYSCRSICNQHNITGNIDEIPCRVTRKRANKIINKRYEATNMEIKITPQPEDDFYGFETNGNRRFLLGDFTVSHNCQLPVVGCQNFCFEAKTWDKCIKNVIYLTEIIRQEDPVFQNCLNEVRIGEISKETKNILRSRCNVELKNDMGIKPTRLYSINSSVDMINETELDKIAESDPDFYEYKMNIDFYGSINNREWMLEKYRKSCIAQDTLQLCKDAQIMLIYNLDVDNGLVNGSRGVVVDFVEGLPLVRFMNGKERIIDVNIWDIMDGDTKLMTIAQLPLKLAWAFTIHKCLLPDTIIYTKNGLYRIKELEHPNQASGETRNINLQVMGKNGFEECTQVYKSIVEPTIKITTSLGYTVEGSHRHPVLTYDGKEIWKKLPELKIGDSIMLKNNINCFGKNISTKGFNKYIHNLPEYADEKLCYIIGLLIGNGCYTQNKYSSIELTIKPDLYDTFKKYVKSIFGIEFTVYKSKNTIRLQKYSKFIREFLKWGGLDYDKSYEKRIPWIVLQNTRLSQIEFLKGLFDSDGGVNKRYVHFKTKSYQLAIDIQNILLNLGIISWSAKNRKVYLIHIIGYQAHLYYKLIGFNSPRKQQLLHDIYGIYNDLWTKTNIGEVPDGKNKIQRLRTQIYKHNRLSCTDLNKDISNLSRIFSNISNGTSSLHYHHLPYQIYYTIIHFGGRWKRIRTIIS
jgi:intein/homing endonuclease/energy-coupling factor transporter ATP-binding protein EcfA2